MNKELDSKKLLSDFLSMTKSYSNGTSYCISIFFLAVIIKENESTTVPNGRKEITMRLMIDGMEIEIKAKGQYSKRFNKEDTMLFLNSVSLYASLAYAYYEERGHEASASRADKFSGDIYAHLKEIGCYDN